MTTNAAFSSTSRLNLRIIAIVSSTFVSMLCTGMALAVLPAWMYRGLGFDSVVVGFTISLQFIATLLSRPFSGQLADRLGARCIVIAGMTGCALSGVLIVVAVLIQDAERWSLAALLLSRVLLGVAQGMIGTGSLSWGIGLVGPTYMSRVISWNGIAGFGALTLGAPLGAVIVALTSVAGVGLLIVLVCAVSLTLAWQRPPSPIVVGKRLPFSRVLGLVAPYGMGLLLSSIGYGVIATFITLYFAAQHWDHAAWALSAFGAAFIAGRVVFAGAIDRFGGYPVALVCFMVETLGLLLLWLTPSAILALMGAALTGLGISLIYPALGIEAVAKIAATSRSAALGAYSVFLDLAVGLTGPLAGVVAGRLGYAAIFLCAALASTLGGVLCGALYIRSRREQEIPGAHAETATQQDA